MKMVADKVKDPHPDKLSEFASRGGAGFSGEGLAGFLDGVQRGLQVVLVRSVAMRVLEDYGTGFRAAA